MILEGLLATTSPDGSPHLAPIGPAFDGDDDRAETLCLRPYQSSTTFANLMRHPEAVFHITDDVELIAQAAIGQLPRDLAWQPCAAVAGWVLNGSCRWIALRVEEVDNRAPRSQMLARVIARGRFRDFLGLQRAKHAVLEAAILSTRLEHLEANEVRVQLDVWRPLVEKTGGEAERRAWKLLDAYIAARRPQSSPAP